MEEIINGLKQIKTRVDSGTITTVNGTETLLSKQLAKMIESAINYTHCSTQLKDKYGEDFAYFVEKKVNARKIEDVYYYDDKLFLCADDLFKEYQKLTKPLIV